MVPWIKGLRPRGLIPTKLVVCGSGSFTDFDYVQRKLDYITYWFDMIEVVFGESKRVEIDGEWAWTGIGDLTSLWAEKNWHDRQPFKTEWFHSENARNRYMVKYVSPDGYCICFGKSPIVEQFLKFNNRQNLRVIKIRE